MHMVCLSHIFVKLKVIHSVFILVFKYFINQLKRVLAYTKNLASKLNAWTQKKQLNIKV